MNTPTKIYIGTRNGKDLSVVDENYPNAVEYISRKAIIKCLVIAKAKYGDDIAAAIYAIEHM